MGFIIIYSSLSISYLKKKKKRNGGCVAVAPCYFTGAKIVLRKRFSATKFWKDIRDHQVRKINS